MNSLSPGSGLHAAQKRALTAEPGARRGHLWLLLLLALVLFSSGLGLRDPWPADEPRYALVAMQMVDSGDWLFPHRGAELYPDKPPLFMWTIAAFYGLTGSLRVAFLLPSLLAGLFTTWLIYDMGARLWSRRVGFYAGLALVTIFQFTLQAKTAQIDAMLCMWTTLGLYGLLRHLLLGPDWRWYLTAFAAMGFGIITKGVGFLPVLLLLPYAYARIRRWPRLPRPGGDWRYWLAGPAVMLATISLWLAPMLITVATSGNPALEAYRDNILWHQTAERYADPWHHFKPFWFLFAQALLLWLPVTVLLPWLIPAWWRRLRRGDVRYLLLLTWIVLVLLFFSASAAKRGVYILPAAPALVLITAPLLAGLWRKVAAQGAALLTIIVIAAIFLSVALIGGVLAPGLGDKLLEGYNIEPWWLFATVGALGVLYAVITRLRWAFLGLAVYRWTVWLLYGWWVYPLFNPVRSSAPFMAEVGERIGPSAPLGLVDWKEQFLLFADRPAATFGFSRPVPAQVNDAIAWLRAGKDRRVLLSNEALAPCFVPDRAIDLGLRHRQRWFLVDQSGIVPRCER